MSQLIPVANRSKAYTQLLRSRVKIPLKAWMFLSGVLCFCTNLILSCQKLLKNITLNNKTPCTHPKPCFLNWLYTLTALILNKIIYHGSHNFLFQRAKKATNSKNKDFNKESNTLSYTERRRMMITTTNTTLMTTKITIMYIQN
jgi:hypothetical protein